MDSLCCEGDTMTKHKQSFIHKSSTAVILAALLIFTPSLIAASGTVNVSTRYQTLEGFGAAGAWYEGWLTDHPNSETLYNLIFDELGLDIYRVRNTYDYDSGYMSRTQTIVTEGLRRNPNLKILISSWSPPTYLKSTGRLDEGTLIGGPSNYDYDGYAQWWADSITAWSGYGVDADYISIQNEPDWDGNDRCLLDPTENSSHAGYDQAFEAVYNEMHSRFGSSMPKMVGPETISFTGAGAYINAMIDQSHAYGYAHHLYGPSNADDPDGYISGMTSFAASYGYKPLFETEFSKLESPGAIYFSDAMNLAILMHNALTVEGVVSYLYWDLYWAEPGCLISFPGYGDPGYTINPVYYAFKHYAKLTDPGWQRVYATEDSADLRMSAYISPDNSRLTIVVINTSTGSTNLTLAIDDFSSDTSEVYQSTEAESWADLGAYNPSMTLPAESITTIALFITGPKQTLSISSTSGGSVTTPGEGDFQYPRDTNATIVATPEQFYHFDVWSGSAVTAGKVADPCAASTTVFMDANYTVLANFELDPPDTTPPSPNPMAWAVGGEPNALGSSSITMTAATATDNDNPPVEYYFECTNHGDANGIWQTSPTYIAQGLEPLTQYTFRVKARDSYLTPNLTGFSDTASATTGPPSTNVEILGDWVTGTTHTAESGYSRALIFIAHSEDDSAITLSSVTYGEQPMTKVIEEVVGTTYRAYVTAYILDEAGIAAATSNTFVPTWSTTPDDSGYASVFLGSVNQTNPIGDSDKNGFESSTQNITTNPLSTGDGDIVFVGATCGNTGDYMVNNGFTEAIENDMSSSTGTNGYKSAIGAAETPSVTHPGPNRQVIIGFVVRAMEGTIDYQNCAQVQAAGYGLVSDLSGDCYVNVEDLNIVSTYWLNTNCGSSGNCGGVDFEPIDGDVDLEDYSDFAVDWMTCNDPGDSGCVKNWRP
jgi:glucuronoarabinoxylan endo-1,4-beta-xylanase